MGKELGALNRAWEQYSRNRENVSYETFLAGWNAKGAYEEKEED